MTIVETRAVTGGVDTHAEVHVAAALDSIGGLLGVKEFAATAAGYADLLGWLGGFGTVALVGIEGTGSYGAGLARHLAAAGVRVVEVDRADRQDRHRAGKSDPLDAVSAARAALSGQAAGAPKGRDGAVEAIRALMVAKRSARHERTQAINQARSLIVTSPDELRARPAGRRPGGSWCSARRGTGPAPPGPPGPGDSCHSAVPPGTSSAGSACRAPAACWCARTTVESALRVQSAPSASSHPARSRPRICGQVPSSDQRRCRL